jgi:Galactose oxidase, central domain
VLPGLFAHGAVHAVLQECARAASRVPCSSAPPVCRLTVKLLTPRGSVPSARGYHSLVALGDSLVLFGGKDGATLSSQSLAVFDCSKRKWSFPGALPLRRTTRAGCGLLSCPVQSAAKAVAAANPHFNLHDCELHVQCHAKYCIHLIAEVQGKGPCARSSHRAVAWRNDTMLLFGGHSGGSERLNDLYALRNTASGYTWSQDVQPVLGARPVGELWEAAVGRHVMCLWTYVHSQHTLGSAARVTALQRQDRHDSHQLTHICRAGILSSCGGGE